MIIKRRKKRHKRGRGQNKRRSRSGAARSARDVDEQAAKPSEKGDKTRRQKKKARGHVCVCVYERVCK